jgi:hypothetical protein
MLFAFLNAVGQIIAQPTVTIVSQTNHGTHYVDNPIVISAAASDSDETLTKLEFRVDPSLVGAVSQNPHQLGFTITNGPSGRRLRAPVEEWEVYQLQGEAGAKLAASYSAELQPRAPKPNNVVQSEKHPGIEYSGILVQAVRSNPIQLINPFAPAIYGGGQANVVRIPVPRAAEARKLWQISF